MLCDGDTVPPAAAEATAAQEQGRLRVLPRYHLENYFLDEAVWAEALGSIQPEGSPFRSAEYVRKRLVELARSQVSYATALYLAARIRAVVGSVDALPAGCNEKTLDQLQDLVQEQIAGELVRVQVELDAGKVRDIVADYFSRLVQSLEDDSEEWKALIPAKPLLARFASEAGLRAPQAKTLYLNVGLASDRAPFSDILSIFQSFAEASP